MWMLIVKRDYHILNDIGLKCYKANIWSIWLIWGIQDFRCFLDYGVLGEWHCGRLLGHSGFWITFLFSILPKVVSITWKRQCVSVISSLFFACAQYVQCEMGLIYGLGIESSLWCSHFSKYQVTYFLCEECYASFFWLSASLELNWCVSQSFYFLISLKSKLQLS